MSLRKLSTRTRVAISKAQKSSGQVVPDLANRVTALEQEDQAINIDLNALFINDAAQDTDITALQTSDTAQNSAIALLQSSDTAQNSAIALLQSNDTAQNSAIGALQTFNTIGYSGTITLVATVNFVAQTLTTKTLTYLNGKLMEVV